MILMIKAFIETVRRIHQKAPWTSLPKVTAGALLGILFGRWGCLSKALGMDVIKLLADYRERMTHTVRYW
jgi:hypothetical protein